MKLLIINEVCGHMSTGKICAQIADEYSANGYEVKIAYGRDSYVPEEYKKYAVRIGNAIDVRFHAIKTRLFDAHGFGSKLATKRFLKWADEFDPDMVWLHNLHGYYINIELLFRWMKQRPDLKVKWTLHDCWAFTGHCSYFTVAQCDLWKTHCRDCCQKKQYPKSIGLDNSYKNYEKKRQSFCGVSDLTIITPSNWLADLVRQSFLGNYPIEVMYNTINEEIFKPTAGDFRKKYAIEQKRMLLGVSNVWEERKGLGDFLLLSSMLDDRYVIVLVGLNEKQLKQLPQNIIGIKRVMNQKELAQIYSAADLFINPSREETFGLTTVEAISCGTDAIVLAGTACEEIIRDKGGIVVPANDIRALYEAVVGYHYQK